MYEGWLTLAAWAQATKRVRLGLMVGANTFREPALDREDGHDARPHLRRSGCTSASAPRGSRRSTRRSASSTATAPGAAALARRGAADHPRHAPRRAADGRRPLLRPRSDMRNDPPPIQKRLPILIGGGGEKVTLKLVAKYADANNVGGGIANVTRKEAILLQHCEDGRARPGGDRAHGRLGVVRHPRFPRGGRSASTRRSSSATATRSSGRTSRSARRRTSWSGSQPYLELGYRHLIAGVPRRRTTRSR